MLLSSMTRIVSAILLSALTLLSASCVQPSQPTTTVDNIDQSNTTELAVITVVTEPSRASPENGNTPNGHVLQIDTYDCGIPDPAVDFARRVNLHGLSVTPEIHAGLTRLAKSSLGETVAEPELAESFHESNDATRFEFLLRPNLRFSDGQPLLASHVKWSWERSLRKSTPPSRARIVLGGILGADAVISGLESELHGIEVVDDRRLIVNLTEPRPDFPDRISDPVGAVLHPENVDSWDDVWINDADLPANVLHHTEIPLTNIPSGAGPFRLVEYVKPEHADTSEGARRRCVLERNPHYWDPRAPSLDGIVATVYRYMWEVPEDTAHRQRNELDRGTLDIGRPSAEFADAAQQSARGTPVLVKGNTNGTVRHLVFNPTVEPFNEIEVRRAFVNVAPSAIREDETRATRIVPGSIATWKPAPFASSTAQLNQVAERALQITMYFHILELAEEMYETVVAAWEDTLNAQVNLEQFQLPDDLPEPPLHELHVAELFIDTYATSPYDVLKSVLEAFGTDNMPPPFAELKAQLDNARHNLDAVSRNSEYQRIEQTLLDEAYVLPIYADVGEFEMLVQPWVHGLKYPLPGGSYYKDVWFDETAPMRTLPVQ